MDSFTGRSVDRKADEFLDEVQRRKLGKYTTEQEADEFSVEYFARIGLAPETRVKTYWNLIRARALDEELFLAANGGLTVAQCDALYLAGWTRGSQASGRESVLVPVGELHRPHHGECYRIFNMDREIRAHELVAGSVPPPSFTAPWESLRVDAQRATESFRPAGPQVAVSAPQPMVQGDQPGLVVDGM